MSSRTLLSFTPLTLASTLALLVAGALTSTLYAPAARACGGLFCSGISPVDQSAEQVLFEVDDDGSVTATVQIVYTGDPRAFSWIIPVHGVPDFVDVASPALFTWLDPATRPRIVPPPATCNGDDFWGLGEGEGEGDGGEGEGAPGVNVTEYDDVGPYDGIVVVDGRDPEALAAWLTEHGYLVTEAMRPVIDEYAVEGQRFLAMRLQPDVGVDAIQPVRFHCPAPNPVVPSRLTSLAAEPHMGMVVTVFANERYEPANWNEVAIDADDLKLAPGTFQTNYQALVALRVDQAGGRAFVVERAASSDVVANSAANVYSSLSDVDWETGADVFYGSEADRVALEDLLALAERRPYVTRFYTRVSAEEMTQDPVFRPAPAGSGDYDGLLDMSTHAPVDVCFDGSDDDDDLTACSFEYCGAGARCGIVARWGGDRDGQAGCACSPTQAVRTVSPTGGFGMGAGSGVGCAELATNVLDDDVNDAACAGVTCGGRGVCQAVNGVPACLCEQGTIGIRAPLEAGGVACVEPLEMRALTDVDPRLVPNVPAAPTQSCASSSSSPAPPALFALLCALALGRVRYSSSTSACAAKNAKISSSAS